MSQDHWMIRIMLSFTSFKLIQRDHGLYVLSDNNTKSWATKGMWFTILRTHLNNKHRICVCDFSYDQLGSVSKSSLWLSDIIYYNWYNKSLSCAIFNMLLSLGLITEVDHDIDGLTLTHQNSRFLCSQGTINNCIHNNRMIVKGA